MKRTTKFVTFLLAITLVIALGSCGSGNAPLLSVTISGTTSAPAGQMISLTANVEYTGTGTLGYSWFFNNSKLSGVTGNMCILSIAIPTDPQIIRVDVSDGDVTASASVFVKWE